MERSKILKYGGITVAVIIVGLILSSIFSSDDPVELALREAIIAQATIVELSDIATEKAASPAVRDRAAIIAGTTTSDLNAFQAIYISNFDLKLQNTEIETIEKFEEPLENFDAEYQATVLDYLLISRDRLENLQILSSSEELSQALAQGLLNQQTHIDALTR